jgi:hypothetical protein
MHQKAVAFAAPNCMRDAFQNGTHAGKSNSGHAREMWPEGVSFYRLASDKDLPEIDPSH